MLCLKCITIECIYIYQFVNIAWDSLDLASLKCVRCQCRLFYFSPACEVGEQSPLADLIFARHCEKEYFAGFLERTETKWLVLPM